MKSTATEILRRNKLINFKDANGQWVCIKEEAFFEILALNKVTFFGFSAEAILAFKELYETYGGPYPATPESIRETFETRR